MITAPLPTNEKERLLALAALNVLDTPADLVLDGLVRSAAAMIGCPISLVSLVDVHRQWFKACVGLDATETPRETAFCAHTILGSELFEVSDATLDPRFADNPLVTGAPHLRFYAGVPLDVDGHKVGTLCVIDRQPRRLSALQRELLRDLARAVEQWMLSWRRHNELRAAEGYRRNLFEQLGDGVLLLDRAHRVRDANPQALAMLGYGRDELLRLRLHDVLAEHEHHRLELEVPALMVGESHLAEWVHRRRDGRHFPVEVRARPLDGQRYLAVLRDITQRHAQDQQLRQLSLAVEQSAESIIITDLTATIEYVNAAAAASSGYTCAEMIGRNSRILQSGNTPSATYRALRTSLAAERPWKGLLFNRRQDGSEYVAFSKITPIRMPHGRVTHYLTLMEDVTEKQRMGEELDRHRHHLEELVAERTAELSLAVRAAEAANQAKSAFLATMSHEIRTPMNGVLGIVDVLRQSSLTPYQADLADTIRESAFALLGIIDDILDFSKIEAGRMVLESAPLALLGLVESVSDGLRPVATSRGVGLHVFVDPSLPDWISGDAVRLRQILNNLLGNAIKFSAGLAWPGQVRLRVEADTPGTMRLRVSDNGIGMAPEAQARIFLPFMQAEGSTTRRYGGTGLGLSICRRLVALFGGEIGVTSVPGEGATFSVTLPLLAHTAESDSATALPTWQDLAGLDCHVALRDATLASDWCAYLAAAGASTQIWPNLDALQQALAVRAGTRPVAIVDTDSDDATMALLQAGAVDQPLALVRIGRGQRRSARLVGPGQVSLDADAMHRTALLHAVALAVGRAASAPDEVAAGLPIGMLTPPSVEEAAAQGRLVLVAEDNEINQKVIRRQLALLGLAVEVADDGLDALARWRRGRLQRYGLLLTDLHMPGMDGYGLSATLRSEEAPGERLPIIALTANALLGEAERCRAAGMDDYLSKPVQLEQLSAALARWLPAASAASTAPTGALIAGFAEPAEDAPLPVLDTAVLALLIGDDPALLAEFQHDFDVSARATAEALRAVVAQADWAAAGAVAHRLKSSSRSVGALALGACCEKLERAGAVGDGAAVNTQLGSFERALAAVLVRLGACRAAGITPPVVANAAAGVMLVDDDPFQLQMLQHQLTAIGVAPVLACGSGALALEWLRGRDTSALLLLLDLNMPGMDGVEFLRHLAERRYAGALVLVSGTDTRVLETATRLAAAHQLAVLSHLPKPVPSEALRALVERWRTVTPEPLQRSGRACAATEIERAIGAGQLTLHYQPKVALADGALVGVEALVRWQHPAHGLIHPNSFVEVAETHGLIDGLTRAVLSQALAQARRWRDAGLVLRVAVNISMNSLERLDFPEFVLEEAARHGVPPSDVLLEVTESRLLRDLRSPMDILTRLRLKNIGLSIDDFGTGHSSLAQLRDIPFDELKIDRGFVHGSGEHATQRAIFAASLDMAHQLGMTAVAEGVEDRADWDFVRAAGCDVAQGFFIAKPMPANALPQWAVQWRQRFEAL